MSLCILSLVLYVVFGQTTVRKLRKNPATKDALGMEFVSGWDIINVASALALPRSLNRKLRESPLAFTLADADILDRYTTKFDQRLALVFYFLFIFSFASLMLLMIISYFGFFE